MVQEAIESNYFIDADAKHAYSVFHSVIAENSQKYFSIIFRNKNTLQLFSVIKILFKYFPNKVKL